jgi:peptidoglycan/xylan/chitin deacetylase (PgdA/CDA1 family)
MRLAFTLDDIPHWPRSEPPAGFSIGSIMRAIAIALNKHGAGGSWGFGNSWAIEMQPDLADVLDEWVAAGHHVGNHTHNHPVLTDIGAGRYCWEIDKADEALDRWISKAPAKVFRYTLCHWGDTEQKRARVAGHLRSRGYAAADVTTWWYEWLWNRAWRYALDRGDHTAMARLESDFIEATVAQVRYDHETMFAHFGRDVPGIALGHTVPFFAAVADRLFERLVREGVSFVSLEDAMSDPAYDQVGTVVSGKFLVYQQKLADAQGHPCPAVAPAIAHLHERVVAEAMGPLL